jgi:hypothetical protein
LPAEWAAERRDAGGVDDDPVLAVDRFVCELIAR